MREHTGLLVRPTTATTVCSMCTTAGYVYDDGYDHGGFGFRPLVCLKSDVKLEANGSGYTIK